MASFKKLVAEIRKNLYEKLDSDPSTYRYEEEDKEMILKKMKYLDRHLKNLQQQEMMNEQAECYGYHAIANLKLEKFEDAKKALEIQLEIAIEYKNEPMQRMAYGNLGVIYKLDLNLPKAIECYQKSLALAVKYGNIYAQSRLFNNLANCEEILMNFESAIEYQLKNLAIAKESNNCDRIVKACGSLAGYYHVTGQLEKSVDHLEQLMEQLRRNLKIVEVLADDASDDDGNEYITNMEREDDEDPVGGHGALKSDGTGSKGGMLSKIKRKVKKK